MKQREFWRVYKGCRCEDTRTGELKPGRTCGCPAFIWVGKKRAKAMARAMRPPDAQAKGE